MLEIHPGPVIHRSFASAKCAKCTLVRELLALDLLLLHVRLREERPSPLNAELRVSPYAIPDGVGLELAHVAALRRAA